MAEILGIPAEILLFYLFLIDLVLSVVALYRKPSVNTVKEQEQGCECPECPEPPKCPEPREPYPTAYRALSELAGCKGTLVVEPKRVVCLEGDESGRLIWPKRGVLEELEGVMTG